jgi:hypothetical protein
MSAQNAEMMIWTAELPLDVSKADTPPNPAIFLGGSVIIGPAKGRCQEV